MINLGFGQWLKSSCDITGVDFGKWLKRSYDITGVVDKYESNHTGDGQTDGQTRIGVRTGKIYAFVRLIVMTPAVTERRTLMTRVSRNVGH